MNGSRPRRRRALALLAGAALWIASALPPFASDGFAQRFGPLPPEALTGVLKRIRDAGVVRIGYREAAAPFAVKGGGAEPYGYAIDLCRAIVDEIVEATGGRPLGIVFRAVVPEERIDRVADGSIDLECGSTSNTAERRTRVAFSPTTFITGTRLAVLRGSGIRSHRDLAGRTLAVASGTTNEAVMRDLLPSAPAAPTLVATRDIDEALALLESGSAAAVASDDILLRGYIARTGAHARIAVVGALLSYETYGIVYARGDPALAGVVDAAFRRLAASGELRSIYNKWFMRPLPNGMRLGVPMGAELQRAFEVLGLPPE